MQSMHGYSGATASFTVGLQEAIPEEGEHDRLKEYVLTLAFLPGRGSALERAVLEARRSRSPTSQPILITPRHGTVEGLATTAPRSAFRCCAKGFRSGALVLTRSQPGTFSDRQVICSSRLRTRRLLRLKIQDS